MQISSGHCDFNEVLVVSCVIKLCGPWVDNTVVLDLNFDMPIIIGVFVMHYANYKYAILNF